MAKKRPASKSDQPDVIKGDPLQYPSTIEKRYQKALVSMINKIVRETEKAVEDIFVSEEGAEYFATDASISSQARIKLNALIDRVFKSVDPLSRTLAEKMVKATDRASKSALHNSASKIAGRSVKTNFSSAAIDDVFKASVSANVDLIRTIPDNYLSQIKGGVMRSIQKGGGVRDLKAEISKFLNKQAKQTRNKAKNVALDQTRKAYNSLNAARMTSIGLDDFEWVASGGGREPRPHHHSPYPGGLNGGIYSLDDLPVIDTKTGERGKPGDAINCKCTMRPVVRFNEK